MNNVKLPDITLAQIMAGVSWVVAQCVAMGVVDNNRAQLILQVSSTVIAGVWTVADAIIRNGRSKIAAAAVATGTTPPGASANP